MKKYNDWKLFQKEVRIGDVVALSVDKDIVEKYIQSLGGDYIRITHNLYVFLSRKWGRIEKINDEVFLIANNNMGHDCIYRLKIPFHSVTAATIMTSDLKDFSLLDNMRQVPYIFNGNTCMENLTKYINELEQDQDQAISIDKINELLDLGKERKMITIGQHVKLKIKNMPYSGTIVGISECSILLKLDFLPYYEIFNISDIEVIYDDLYNMNSRVVDMRESRRVIPTGELDSSYYGKFLVCDIGFGIFVKMDEDRLYLVSQQDGAEMAINRHLVPEVHIM